MKFTLLLMPFNPMRLPLNRSLVTSLVASSNTKSEVADAAMNLVDMVTSSVGTSQLSMQNATNQHLVDIKKNLAGVEATLNSNAAKDQYLVEIEKKITSLADKMDTQQKTLDTQQKTLEAEGKMRRIEFALQNLSLASKYFKPMKLPKEKNCHGYCTTIAPDELLKDILLSFRKGEGMLIQDYIWDKTRSNPHYLDPREIKNEWKTDFRNELSNQLRALVGQTPRFHDYGDGRMAVFYN